VPQSHSSFTVFRVQLSRPVVHDSGIVIRCN
jgi:hypothetical protein